MTKNIMRKNAIIGADGQAVRRETTKVDVRIDKTNAPVELTKSAGPEVRGPNTPPATTTGTRATETKTVTTASEAGGGAKTSPPPITISFNATGAPELPGPVDNEVDDQTPLSEEEKIRFAECEKKLSATKQAFIEFGQNLYIIKKGKLYREKFRTFENYCATKWGFSRVHVNRLIDASQTATELKNAGIEPPTNEAQARELKGINPETAKAVLAEAKKQAGQKAVKATHIKQAKRKLKIQPAINPLGDVSSEDDNAENTAEAPRISEIVTLVKQALELADETEANPKLCDLLLEIEEALESLAEPTGAN